MSRNLARVTFAAVVLVATPVHATNQFTDADVVVVKPLPGRATIPAVRPDWCGSKVGKASRDREDARYADSSVMSDGNYTLRALHEMAKVSCDNGNVDAPAWQKQIASWRQGWVNFTQLTDKEDRAYWALLVDEKRRGQEATAACDAIAKPD